MKIYYIIYLLGCFVCIQQPTYSQNFNDYRLISFQDISTADTNLFRVGILHISNTTIPTTLEVEYGLENHDSNSAYFTSRTYLMSNYTYDVVGDYYTSHQVDTFPYYHPTYLHDLKLIGGNSMKTNQPLKLTHGLIDFESMWLDPYTRYLSTINGYRHDSISDNWIYGGYYGASFCLSLNHSYLPCNLDSAILEGDYINIDVDFIRVPPWSDHPTNQLIIDYDGPTISPYMNNCEAEYTYIIPPDSVFHVNQLIPTDSFNAVFFMRNTYYDNIFFYPVYNRYICPSDSIEINGVFVSEEGTYIDSLYTTLGTDSIVGVNLMFRNQVFGDTIEAEICEGDYYLFMDTLEIYNPGLFTFVTPTSGGCDSIFYLQLNIQNNMIPNTISISNGVLSYNSPQSNYTYQWYNESTNQPISGETSPTFSPTENGTYTLEISDGICTQRTQSITTSLGYVEWMNSISFSPNPFTNAVHLELTEVFDKIELQIYDLQSKLIYQNTYTNTSNVQVNTELLPDGIYYFTVTNKNHMVTKKMVCKK